MFKELCKGGCGNEAVYNGWCKIKWKSGNKFGVACPISEQRRRASISKFRIKEAKEGRNPMQNPSICAKNHSEKRNKKCSEKLKELGRNGLLPQQIESKELKEKRKKNISASLNKLFINGMHPRQLEGIEERRERLNKMAFTLKKLGAEGKLPIQNMSKEQKIIFANKISKCLIDGIKSGRITLSKSWKKVPYKNLMLRSNWEKIVAEFLDKNNLSWDYETLKLDYFDITRKINTVTIPDFYIPSMNLIIEVKSNAEFNSQKTKDKTLAIKNKGFNFVLVGRKEIELIKSNECKFLKLIGGGINEKG